MLQPFTFHFYGLFIALGLIFVYFYLKANSKKFNLPFSEIESAYIVSLIFGLLGARIYHIFSSLPYYLNHPLQIFFVWQGGLGIFGLILGVFLGLLLFSKFKKVSLISLLNLFFPPLLLAQALGRIGNYFNNEGFGLPTNLPWGIFIPISFRPTQYISYSYFHPTFFYEAILCFVAFLLYRLISKKTKKTNFGFAYYLISYGIIRFFTEFFRIDTWVIGQIKVGFVLSVLILGLGVTLLLKPKKC